ncbi:uncharacterized protein BDCG_00308 [Blastomyces dermatitidis ER-3]|uniref:Uncharacterized protein n=2 Tax=Ajellomyces dermatitidis TaxID=5039 RepID=F2TPJ6_AJEDA|nr:uncharacterized protein BDCG_00308 [Blastomyces dermatitidis ER-3]EEQ83503.1 hypothetical protein BDCG_00308 [Blastomyces dermatitidis ER-3]EGE85159.1 hypothetical protein BDDG_08104 [Blastomyces dermatitidis ATCC 18188]
MPRPPVRRGRRPKTVSPSEVVAVCNDRQSDAHNFAVVIKPNLDHAQDPKEHGGNTRDDGENSPETAYLQRSESVANEERHLEAVIPQAQTPISEHQNGASDLPTRIDVMSSAIGKALHPSLPNRGDTSSRAQKIGTPAFESSMLSNFRRRPRQPSILQMMQGDPSSELDDDDDMLGSFDPDDESTPLKFSNRQSIPYDSVSIPSSALRDLSPARLSKRKLHSKTQVQVSPSPDPSKFAIAVDETTDNSTSEDDSLPTPRGAQSPEPLELSSQTMMPPESSPASSVEKRRLDTAHDEFPENETSLPNRERQPATIYKPRVSTATLRENLLPQRRRLQRRRVLNHANTLASDDIENEPFFSDHSDTFEADQDELSYTASKVFKRRKDIAGVPEASRGGGNRELPGTVGNNRGRRRTPAMKSSTIGSSRNAHLTRSKRGNNTTYFSHDSHEELADKENQSIHASSSPPDSEEPFSTADISPPASERVFLSDELMQQAQKFAEISQWPLDFEDVAVTSCQSSPAR